MVRQRPEIQKIRNTLFKMGLEVSNCVGLGSDGASVMFGRKGVCLGQDSPLLTHVHSVAHRLSLACSDAAKDNIYLGHSRTHSRICIFMSVAVVFVLKNGISAGCNGRTSVEIKRSYQCQMTCHGKCSRYSS